MVQSWEQVAKKKQHERAVKLGRFWKDAPEITSYSQIKESLTDRENALTELTATELLQKYHSKEITCVEVTNAFCKRATLAQKLTNCCTEIFFEGALARAAEIDEEYRRTKTLVGPLHGLPVSIKDSFHVKGYDSSIGYSILCNLPQDKDSAVYRTLTELGAVVTCKTNVPQTMMTADSDNPIWGRTVNPYNKNLTAGGSSGGEGALVGCRGSVFGIGTDIAGSIRIPALCCGTYGFKPASWRFPYEGQADPCGPGRELVPVIAGPLANSAEDLKLVFQAALESRPWEIDSTLHGINFRNIPTPKNIKVMVLPSLETSPADTVTIKAVKSCMNTLQSSDCVEIKMVEKFPQLSFDDLWDTFYSLDGNKSAFDMIDAGGDPHVPSLDMINQFIAGDHSLDKLIKAKTEVDKYALEVRRFWQENLKGQYDVLICPGAPVVSAPLHDTYPGPDYTGIWNLLDMPAVIIPISKVAVTEEGQVSQHGTSMVPVCLQIVGTRFHEEELLESTIVIDKILNNRV